MGVRKLWICIADFLYKKKTISLCFLLHIIIFCLRLWNLEVGSEWGNFLELCTMDISIFNKLDLTYTYMGAKRFKKTTFFISWPNKVFYIFGWES